MKDENNEFFVTSEIAQFFVKDTSFKPLINEKNVISKFEFFKPDINNSERGVKQPEKDEDGDYLVERKKFSSQKDIIFLEHSGPTQIRFVGLQIWRAALLLADFILYCSNLIKNKIVLELGSGVGLTSVVTGMFAKQIICTDLNIENILKLLKSNIERNKELIKGEVIVNELDFFKFDPTATKNKKLLSADIVLASDVIYDNDVTEAFIETLIKIFKHPPKKTLYLALEKRYVFTVADLDSVAPCFEHFQSYLKLTKSKYPFPQWEISEIPIDFPQYFNYERTQELTLLKITC